MRGTNTKQFLGQRLRWGDVNPDEYVDLIPPENWDRFKQAITDFKGEGVHLFVGVKAHHFQWARTRLYDFFDTHRDVEGFTELKGYPLHGVSECGSVIRYRTRRLLTLKLSVAGYHGVSIADEEKNIVGRLTHRLVAQTFIPNPDNKPEVNHIDGDKLNNCVKNLEWNTPIENTHHALTSGLSQGKDWSDEELRYLLTSMKSNVEIGKEFGVSSNTVETIRKATHKRYADLTPENYAEIRDKRFRLHRKIIDDATIAKVLRMVEKGSGTKEISSATGLYTSSVTRIRQLKYKRYRKVAEKIGYKKGGKVK